MLSTSYLFGVIESPHVLIHLFLFIKHICVPIVFTLMSVVSILFDLLSLLLRLCFGSFVCLTTLRTIENGIDFTCSAQIASLRVKDCQYSVKMLKPPRSSFKQDGVLCSFPTTRFFSPWTSPYRIILGSQ